MKSTVILHPTRRGDFFCQFYSFLIFSKFWRWWFIDFEVWIDYRQRDTDDDEWDCQETQTIRIILSELFLLWMEKMSNHVVESWIFESRGVTSHMVQCQKQSNGSSLSPRFRFSDLSFALTSRISSRITISLNVGSSYFSHESWYFCVLSCGVMDDS